MAEALGLLAGVAAIAAGSCVIRLHLLPTGHDPIRDAVSDYGAGPYGAWYRAAAAGAGLAAILAAAGLALSIEPVPGDVVAPLAVFGVARLAITRFPTDLPGAPATRTGRVHVLLAAVAFASIAIASARLGAAAHGDREWRAASGLLHGLGWAVVATAVGTFLTHRLPQLQRVFGLGERLLYVAMLTWLTVVGVELVRLGS